MRRLAEALRTLHCADGFVYHGDVLGDEALEVVAAAIIDRLTAAGFTPPTASSADDVDHLHIDHRGITVGDSPLGAPIDPAPGITIHPAVTDDLPRVDVRLIALAGVSVDDDHVTATTNTDGTITVHEKEPQQ